MRPEGYPWSSAGAHLRGEDDGLVVAASLLAVEPDWGSFLSRGVSAGEAAALRRHERTGRPAGSGEFVAAMEALTGRRLQPHKTGPKGLRIRN